MTTVPRRVAGLLIDPTAAKILQLPKEISGYKYLMAWHARLESDAQHRWLRQTMREAAKEIYPLT